MPDILRILQVAFGIGLIIFVHELGHYLAARWAGVRVHVFSLGFGPKLFGVRRGDTQFQVSAVPLGGYVAVAGEVPGAVSRDPLPDELGSKTIFQRFVFYSGGVLMNLVFALVALPIAFGIGVPFNAPLIQEPAPGSPAWKAGLAAGESIVEINGAPILSFMDLATKVALAESGPLDVEVLGADGETRRRIEVTPEFSEELGVKTIGVRGGADPEQRLAVAADGPAAAAGLRTGERLVAVLDAQPGGGLDAELQRALGSGEPLRLRVAGEDGVERTVELTPEQRALSDRPRLGVGPAAHTLDSIRQSPVTEALELQQGDRLLALGGHWLALGGDLERALLAQAGTSLLWIERDGELLELEVPDLSVEQRVALARDLALSQDTTGTRLGVMEREAGFQGGLRHGDRVLRIDGEAVSDWSDVERLVGAAGAAGKSLKMEVERTAAQAPGSAPELLTLTLTPAASTTPIYGFGLKGAQYVYRASGPLDALQVGLRSSWTMLQDVWLTLKRMLTGQVSTDNIGGIVSISVVSYSFAESGFAKLLYFLCLLSLNLAFLNVLPVPLLDGGHLFFLGVEKLKGSPVSDRVVGYSQMVGLVLLVGLMVYVTYNDLMRVLPGFQ